MSSLFFSSEGKYRPGTLTAKKLKYFHPIATINNKTETNIIIDKILHRIILKTV